METVLHNVDGYVFERRSDGMWNLSDLFDVWNNAHPDDARDIDVFLKTDNALKQHPKWCETDGYGITWVNDTVFTEAAQTMDESLYIRAVDVAFEMPESALCRIMDMLDIPQADQRFDAVVREISLTVYGDDRKFWNRTDIHTKHSERETIREILLPYIPEIHNGMDYDTFLNRLRETEMLNK